MDERIGASRTRRWTFGNAEVRPDERLLLIDGQPVTLGSRAFDLLVFLIVNRGRVAGKEELLASVWPDVVVEESNLAVHVAALRKLLGPGAISTVPGRGYRFTAPLANASPRASVGPAAQRVDGGRGGPAQATLHKPSIAVLPFANLSGDATQDYFVDGVVDDLITALSRVRAFFVIARGSSFTYKGRAVDVRTVGHELGVQYVLEGGLRQADARLRVTARLVETTSGHQIWVGRFESALDDVFALQDDIVAQAVAAIEPSLILAEVERARTKPTENLQAYDLCLRALPLVVSSGSRDEVKRAAELLGRAIAADPGYSYAKALYAWAHAMAWSNRWIGRTQALDAMPLAVQAQADHRDDPTTLAFAGHALAIVGRRHDQALRALDLALTLNPNSLTALQSAGWVRAYVGDTDVAVRHLERALTLNPLDPGIGYVHCGLAYAHLVADRGEEALATARRAMLELPRFVPGKLALMHALVRTGRVAEAREVADELKARVPRLTISRYGATLIFVEPGYVSRCLDDLRTLGFTP